MNAREAKFITNHVGPWMKTKGGEFGVPIVYEAKEVETTCYDSEFETQQLPSLRQAASWGGLHVKIPDGSGLATPFDGFFIAGAYAVVAIEYRKKGWVLIEISEWDERTVDKVDWEEAKKMSDFWYTNIR
tara:strand:+ start:1757 stop:2146 length:390 start_codon:yes stop_codon:yes gene_type:complete